MWTQAWGTVDEGRDSKGRANLGRSLIIKGEVTGSEDLTIDGRVEGRIHLDGHDLTIGESSKVSAEVQAKNITNPTIEEVYRSEFIGDDVTRTSYTKGIEYSIGLSAEFTF